MDSWLCVIFLKDINQTFEEFELISSLCLWITSQIAEINFNNHIHKWNRLLPIKKYDFMHSSNLNNWILMIFVVAFVDFRISNYFSSFSCFPLNYAKITQFGWHLKSVFHYIWPKTFLLFFCKMCQYAIIFITNF